MDDTMSTDEVHEETSFKQNGQQTRDGKLSQTLLTETVNEPYSCCLEILCQICSLMQLFQSRVESINNKCSVY